MQKYLGKLDNLKRCTRAADVLINIIMDALHLETEDTTNW